MKTILIIALSLINLTVLFAQEKYAVETGKVLLDGYDPVSYFDGKARMGSADYSYDLNGRQLLFSSAENLIRFQDNTEKYTPAYGGWCAIAMVDETFIVPDYTLYKIQDGDLLFFSVRAFFNGLTQWDKDADKNKILADTNYVKLFEE